MILEVDNINTYYGEARVLYDVSLSIGEGEVVALLGPNGAGKTTTIRSILGLTPPKAGSISFDGNEITRKKTHSIARAGISWVPDDRRIFPALTVRRNLELGMKKTKYRAWKLGEMFEIFSAVEYLMERECENLSGGEMQRVALGRAIVRRPGLFLMDEPLTNLDAKLRESLRVELVTLRRELGTPMIFVTHDQVEAMSMGDRIAVLHEGRFLQEGTPNEIYTRPCSPEVARQLGSPPINLVSVSNRDGYWAATDGTRIVANQSHEPEAIIGIRPEDFAPTGGTIPGEVKVVEHMGPTAIIVATWAGQNIHITLPKHVEVRVGDVLHPLPDSTRLSVWHSH